MILQRKFHFGWDAPKDNELFWVRPKKKKEDLADFEYAEYEILFYNNGWELLTSGTESELTELRKNLDAEIKRAKAAEEQLQKNIDAEAESREKADTKLQSNIDSEASVRETEDKALLSKIESETSAREKADSGLNSLIEALDKRVTALENKE